MPVRSEASPNSSAARAEAIANHACAARGVVGRHDLDPGQGLQEHLALRQRLRVREHALDLAQLDAGQCQQVVHDRQLGLGDDRQIVLEHQIVVAMDAAADRVLDRQQSVRRVSGGHGREHVFEPIARHRV
jgi:hypothetical protein